jgi:hypothetical protein
MTTMETVTNYAFEKVGDCIGQHHAGKFDNVTPAEEIQPWDVVVVRPREGTLIARELLTGGLDALGKIFLGRTKRGVHLATLNPPACIDLPLEEIEALHRVDGGLVEENLTPFERGAIVYLSQFNTLEPIAPIGPDWRPHGAVGLSAITGKMASRYMSRNIWGAALGPTAEVLETAAVLPGAFINNEWTASDTRALRKLLPYQNLFYLRRLLDQVERNTNDLFGVPQKRTVEKK